MRTPRKLLLLGQDEEKLGVLRFVLRNSTDKPHASHYSVTSVNKPIEALQALRTQEFDLLLIQSPIPTTKPFLRSVNAIANWLPVLTIAEVMLPLGQDYPAEVIFPVKMVELLERISNILSFRKRGPRKGSPAALRVGKATRARIAQETLLKGAAA
jgi:hypothetical protein